MKKLLAIIFLVLGLPLAAAAQRSRIEAWTVERTVEMPGRIKEDLYARAEEALKEYENICYISGQYDYYYNRSILIFHFDLKLKGERKIYRADLSYHLAIYCYDGYYTVKITDVLPSRVHGGSFMTMPIDNTGLRPKDADFLDAVRFYLTDDLDWRMPTIKRIMSHPVPGWSPPSSANHYCPF